MSTTADPGPVRSLRARVITFLQAFAQTRPAEADLAELLHGLVTAAREQDLPGGVDGIDDTTLHATLAWQWIVREGWIPTRSQGRPPGPVVGASLAIGAWFSLVTENGGTRVYQRVPTPASAPADTSSRLWAMRLVDGVRTGPVALDEALLVFPINS